MKEKLMNLINKVKKEYANDVIDCTESEYIAECILSDGWVRHPCKVGDKIYAIYRKQVFEATVFGVITHTYKNNNWVFLEASVKDDTGCTFSRKLRYGEDAFLTRKEAERWKRY